jgi:hypothetical protein
VLELDVVRDVAFEEHESIDLVLIDSMPKSTRMVWMSPSPAAKVYMSSNHPEIASRTLRESPPPCKEGMSCDLEAK